MAEQVRHHLTIPQYIADYELGRLAPEELLTDVLTNMRHFADETGCDFDTALDSSSLNHFAETTGREPRVPAQGH
jgi:hypothetical protein